MGIREWLTPETVEEGFDPRRELARITGALLHSATTLLDVDDEQEVLRQYCRALTEEVPSIVLAWTWFGAPTTQVVMPQICEGSARAYAQSLRVPRNPLTERGPLYGALAGHQPKPFDISGSSPFGPWREAARVHGIRSVLALPLKSSFDAQRGTCVIYANVDRYFEQVGVGVFEALAALFSAVLSRAARHAAMARAVTHDALTGLMNRHAEPLITRRLLRMSDADAPSAVLLFDLDHFKQVNDTQGHAGGDAVLQNAARALSSAVRAGDLVARWGGEEFLVGLPGTSQQAALNVAEKLRACLAEVVHQMPSGDALRVTASIGCACLAANEPLEAALARADEALYAAKRSGRNRVVAG